MPVTVDPLDALRPNFDALEVFEELAECAIASGAEKPALEKVLVILRELRDA
jgi:hypothetical protein